MSEILTLRSKKGSELTYEEVDNNFLYLDSKINSIPITQSPTERVFNIEYTGLIGTLSDPGSGFSENYALMLEIEFDSAKLSNLMPNIDFSIPMFYISYEYANITETLDTENNVVNIKMHSDKKNIAVYGTESDDGIGYGFSYCVNGNLASENRSDSDDTKYNFALFEDGEGGNIHYSYKSDTWCFTSKIKFIDTKRNDVDSPITNIITNVKATMEAEIKISQAY